jgi:hypothetical protein
MVNPDLLYKLGNKGALLEEKSIGVLGLSAYDLKRLEEAGICSLKHLAVWYDSDILTIPHFGIKKVRRLKAELESYLSAMLTEQTREFDPQPESQEISTTDLDELDPMAIHSSANFYLDSELEAFSKSLDKLKKRLISLELRLAKARIKTRKRTLDRTEFV